MKKLMLTLSCLMLFSWGISAQTIVYCGKSTLAHYHSLFWEGILETIEAPAQAINVSPELALDAEAQITNCLGQPGDVYIVNPIDETDIRWQTLAAPSIAIGSAPAWATVSIQYDFAIIAETLPQANVLEVQGRIMPLPSSQKSSKPKKQDMSGKYVFVGGHLELTRELLATIREAKRPASVLDASPLALQALQHGDIDRIFQRNPYLVGQTAAQTAIEISQGNPVEDQLIQIDSIQAETFDDDLARLHIPQETKDIDPDAQDMGE